MPTQFAQVMLLAWIPIVLLLFVILRPRDAVITAFITATLFLPNISFPLSGLPDFSKTSASVYAVIICVLIFDVQRVISLRFNIFDCFVIVYCLISPALSAFSNNSGAYEALSAVLDQLFFWGFPYFIGRLYLSDLEGMKRFCTGLAISGLIYAPLCLIEIRLSPQINTWVYGTGGFESLRFGGYRPRVFFNQGLELGIWMTSATMMAWGLRNSGAVKKLWGLPFVLLTVFLTAVTVLCKASGALLLLAVGLSVLWYVRRAKKFWPIWIILAVAPLYAVTRTTGQWTGSNLVEVIDSTLGGDRAQSVEYRFRCEEGMFEFVRQRPLLGFGRLGGFNKTEQGDKLKYTIDGFWMIVLGTQGALGLTMFLSMHGMPIALAMRRIPVRTWNDPEVAPAVTLMLMLALFNVENLSNAMPNQIYALVMGGGMGLSVARRSNKHRDAAGLARGMGLAREGHEWEAEAEFRRVIDHCSGRHVGEEGTTIRAAAFEALGEVLRKGGRPGEAESAFREALFDRSALASGSQDPARLRDLGLGHEALARVLADLGQVGQAIEERRKAMEIWNELAAGRPDDPDLQDLRANAFNDFAWLLTAGGDPSYHDPARAAELAAEAVRLTPDRLAFWNTMGVARYRAGDWAGAVESLEHSVSIGPPGGTAFDLFFLAMAYCQLGRIDQARACLGRAQKWTDRHRPDHHGLASFRREAEAILETHV